MREAVRIGGSVFFERFSLPPDAWAGTLTAHPTGRMTMAANPIKPKLLGDIEQAGGWEKVFERVASGESQTAIAASLDVYSTPSAGVGVSTKCAFPYSPAGRSLSLVAHARMRRWLRSQLVVAAPVFSLGAISGTRT